MSGTYLVLTAALTGLVVLGAFYARLLIRARENPPGQELSDGCVLMLLDGIVRQASDGATQLLGECVGRPVSRVLGDLVGPEAEDVRNAVSRLEATGEPVNMLIRTAEKQSFELVGEPAGAMIRLVLRDAKLLEDALRRAEARMTQADDALNSHEWAQETLHGLIEEAPIIAWQRTADGVVNWSGGRIKTRTSAVSAEQAVDLIVARTKLNRQPSVAGQPQKSRIEIVVNEGTETVSLQVIEIVRDDGLRIGIATDAGMAALAERTLTRFVQTMTETFAHLTVGLAIFDRNQTLALFNPALVQMWQVEPAWLARRPSLRDIIDELRSIRRLPEVQDFHKWRTRLVSLFDNTEAADYEELWHLADGSNIRVLARPHPHGSLAFIFDDVTERMRLEQRYRHSIDLRRATLDGLTAGIAVFGPNGLLQFVNQSFHQIWGTDSGTVYAAMHARQVIRLCEDVTVDEDVWHRLHSFITGEESRRAWTARLEMTSGRILTARFSPLPDGSTMAVFLDITDSERIADALRRRDDGMALMQAANAGVVHRAAAILRPAVAALGKGQEAAGDVSTEALLAALDEISLLSDGPPAAADGAGASIADICAYAVAASSHAATEKGVSLEADLSNPVLKTTVDPAIVTQAAHYMIAGALDAVAPGSALRIAEGGAQDRPSLVLAIGSPGQALAKAEITQAGSVLVSKRMERLARHAGFEITVAAGEPDGILLTCVFPDSGRQADGRRQRLDADLGTNVSRLPPPTGG